MKILAMYLPQYHEVEENNKWWGHGYTEWTAVKRAKKLYKGHYQPKIPLGENYYDLSDENAATWKWQSELANQYGVYGFCIYHYWFKGQQLLEKPMEILLKHREIDINYCISWANETWTKTWYGLEKELLMEQTYGEESDWIEHFNYLLPFFLDDRYIKVDNKPMINIYKTSDIECLKSMVDCWNRMAKANGFDGIYIVSGNTAAKLEDRTELVDAFYNFEPGYTLNHYVDKWDRFKINVNTLLRTLYNKVSPTKIIERVVDSKVIYKAMNKEGISKGGKPVFTGTYPMWDNTPRRDYKGLIYKNSSPQQFEKSLRKIKEVHQNEFIYINAWNEWGEGCYLEPDQENKYAYLETIKKVFGADSTP